MKRLRIFYAGDIHGSDICYRKFINAWKVYQADLLILGGDITGKAIVPIIRENGHWSAHFHGDDLRFEGEGAVASFEESVRHNGFYPFRTTHDEVEEMGRSDQKVQAVFVAVVEAQMRRWMALADERLAGSGVQCFIMPGNDDAYCIDPIIDAAERVCNPAGRTVDLGTGHQMISGAFSNATPWHSAREWSEERIAATIDEMMRPVRDPSRAIFNLHVPPHGTGIDTVQQVDAELRPVYKAGHPVQIPAGSTAVRDAIRRYQPLLGLHGHVHEGKGTARIGRTLCINPGSEYSSGRLHGVLVDIDETKVHTYLFTMG
jgi:Icc-related predicted phosphoesterase